MSDYAEDDEIDQVMKSVRKLVTRDDDARQSKDDAESDDGPVLLLTPSLRVEGEGVEDNAVQAEEGVVPAEDNVVRLDTGAGAMGNELDATAAQLASAMNDSEKDLEEAVWVASGGVRRPTEPEVDATEIDDQSHVNEEAENVSSIDTSMEPKTVEPETADEMTDTHADGTEVRFDENVGAELHEPVAPTDDDTVQNVDAGTVEDNDELSDAHVDVVPPEEMSDEPAIMTVDDVSHDEMSATIVDEEPDEDATTSMVEAAYEDETSTIVDDPREEPLLTGGDDKESDLGAFFSAEAALDRELLRQMVQDILQTEMRDMVQAELRGDLGHKITGTVRKLVRREMNRILTSRELD